MTDVAQLAYDAKTARPCPICEEESAAGSLMVRALGGSAHIHCKKRREALLSTPAAAEKLGISVARVRRLAKKAGIEPEDWYVNPHYRSGPQCPLWSPEEVENLRTSPLLEAIKCHPSFIRAAQAREAAAKRAESERKKIARAQRRRQRALIKRYPDWRQALLPAAEAMFNLNRFAKYRSCGRWQRNEIYELKNRFIRLLYNQGFCVEARRHVVSRDVLECYECMGDGCGRCGFSGAWRVRDARTYVAFRFTIDGQLFSWHQPEEFVTWSVKYSCDASPEWTPENGEKPISLSTRLFEFAKALIMYVIERDIMLPKR